MDMNDWIEGFHRQTTAVISEPFFNCLAEAVAIVESGRGRWVIRGGEGLNEIGYKALEGHPSKRVATRESVAGRLKSVHADFRLFRDREEQARALLWLMRSSGYYEAARLLYLLAFYAAYAPGREDGARALARAFNERARTGLHAGVRPIGMIEGEAMDTADREINHAAARQAVRMFAELTRREGKEKEGEHG